MARRKVERFAALGDPSAVDPRTGTLIRKQEITNQRKRYQRSWLGRIHGALAHLAARVLARPAPRQCWVAIPPWRERLFWLCSVDAEKPGTAWRLLANERQAELSRSYSELPPVSRLRQAWERWSPWEHVSGRRAWLTPAAYWRMAMRRLHWRERPIQLEPALPRSTCRPAKRWRLAEAFLPEFKGSADGQT